MLDPNTGLPELPEDFYWKISNYTNEYLRIELFRRYTYTKKGWFGQDIEKVRTYAVEWTVCKRLSATRENIISNCQRVLQKYNPWNPPVVVENVTGDYPPKSLQEL